MSVLSCMKTWNIETYIISSEKERRFSMHNVDEAAEEPNLKALH